MRDWRFPQHAWPRSKPPCWAWPRLAICDLCSRSAALIRAPRPASQLLAWGGFFWEYGFMKAMGISAVLGTGLVLGLFGSALAQGRLLSPGQLRPRRRRATRARFHRAFREDG